MKPLYLLLAGGAVVLAACSAETEESRMPDMTAEDHARMQAGGTEGERDTAGVMVRRAVHLSGEEERALGVVYTTVQRETLTRTIRTVGHIAAPEPNIADITPKIDGFVEQLFVSYTGESVRSGQPLLTLYSPVLVAAQEELLAAKRMAASVDPTA